MIEMLVVVAILAVLVSLLFPALRMVKRTAQSASSVNGLKNISNATIRWATDNGDKLPSPQYSGSDNNLPKYWDYQETGTGLWLDGVVFAAVYVERDSSAEEDEAAAEDPGLKTGEEKEALAAESYKDTTGITGGHLIDTFFESERSVHVTRGREQNWYKHSYAMNANLEPDKIHKLINKGGGDGDEWLSEKTRANLVHAPAAMLYVDCIESNVVMATDRQLILDTIEERWGGAFAVTAFLDGHVEKRKMNEFPDGSPESDKAASRFWRGVDPD